MIVDTPGAVLNGTVVTGEPGIGIHVKASGVRLRDVTVSNCGGSGIHVDGGLSDVLIDGAHITDCGLVTDLDPTWQGAGVYAGPVAGLAVRSSHIRRTRGHAAVFLNDPTRAAVFGNDVAETFFRGIQVYGAAVRTVIAGNDVSDTGALNTTGSSMACNGIYLGGDTLDPRDIVVTRNTVSRAGENGIEGKALILDNTVTDTGWYDQLVGPSKEGIYVFGGGQVIGNMIIRPHDRGIYAFGTFSDMAIEDNTIIGASRGIEVHASGGRCEDVAVVGNRLIDCTETLVVGRSAGGSLWNVVAQDPDSAARYFFDVA